MAKASIENIDKHFNEMMRNKEFRHHYEIERVKVVLAQKIAQMRQEKHLNQKGLAEKLGVSQQFVSQIETGEGKNLTLDTLIRIAESLGRKVKISFPKNDGNSSGLEIA